MLTVFFPGNINDLVHEFLKMLLFVNHLPTQNNFPGSENASAVTSIGVRSLICKHSFRVRLAVMCKPPTRQVSFGHILQPPVQGRIAAKGFQRLVATEVLF